MGVPYEVLVEVGDQTSWEVHDALFSTCGSGPHRMTKLKSRDRGLQASLSTLTKWSRSIGYEAGTSVWDSQQVESICRNLESTNLICEVEVSEKEVYWVLSPSWELPIKGMGK